MKSKWPILISMSFLLGCGECPNDITIFQGLHFNDGEFYKVTIGDEEFIRSDEFHHSINSGRMKVIGHYCSKSDSARVVFNLNGKDTVFFISPAKTKKLYIGSDVRHNFSVMTDETPRAWAEM